MLFKPWKPKELNVYIRIYVYNRKDEYLSQESDKIQIKAPSENRKQEIRDFIISQGIDLDNINLTILAAKLKNNGLLTEDFYQPPARAFEGRARFKNLSKYR